MTELQALIDIDYHAYARKLIDLQKALFKKIADTKDPIIALHLRIIYVDVKSVLYLFPFNIADYIRLNNETNPAHIEHTLDCLNNSFQNHYDAAEKPLDKIFFMDAHVKMQDALDHLFEINWYENHANLK